MAGRQAPREKANALKKIIFEKFWDETKGCFREAIETPESGPEANALALSMRLVSPEQALRIAHDLKKSITASSRAWRAGADSNTGLASLA